MRKILSDWYNEDVCKDDLRKEEVIAKLVTALENSDKHVIAKNIKKMFPDMFWPKAGENTNAVVVGPHNADISNIAGYDIDNRKKRPIINCGDEMSDILPIFQERENGGHIKCNPSKERIQSQLSVEQLYVVDAHDQGDRGVYVRAAASKAIVTGLWHSKWTKSRFVADQELVLGLLQADKDDILASINPTYLHGRNLKIQNKSWFSLGFWTKKQKKSL